MKIGNTSFDVEEMKKLTFEEFKKQFRGKVYAPGLTLEEVYTKVTGKKVEKSTQQKVVEPAKNKVEVPAENKAKSEKPEEKK